MRAGKEATNQMYKGIEMNVVINLDQEEIECILAPIISKHFIGDWSIIASNIPLKVTLNIAEAPKPLEVK